MIKKIICIILSLLLCLLLTACGLHSDEDNPTLDIHENALFDGRLDDTTKAISDEDSFIFTWMTYSEIAVTQKLREKTAYEKHIASLFDKMKSAGVTDCFVHVRAFADAMYPSELFPESKYASGAEGFDPFQVIINLAEKKDIAIHAWINPYRISSKPLTKDSFYYERSREKDTDIVSLPSGVYFNPCSLDAQKLIIQGVQELLSNYSIKGIHIDDYFYPPDFGNKDSKDYNAYRKNGGKLSLSCWRRENVNSLVSALYSKVKACGEDKIFSVSPAGNIDRNLNEIYADVKLWCKGGYCDVILPQIYFGFENDTIPFEKCLSDWLGITDGEKVTLIPALALYKRGKEDIYAGTGKDEWIKNDDVIDRQIEAIIKAGCHGFGVYSSSYINIYENFTLGR